MPYIGNTAADRFVAAKAATQFSGDGSETVFTLEHAVGSDEDILVTVDGVIQEPSVAYAVSNGTTLTFTSAPSSNSGNNIFVYYLFRTVGTISHPSNNALTASTGTFSDDVTLATNKELRLVDTNESIKSDGSKLIVKSGGTTFNLPTSDGSDGQALVTDGSGTLSFASAGVSGISSSSSSNAIVIDSSGRVTLPLQPAFMATSGGPSNFSRNTEVTVTFGSERFDIGTNFASNTFTAPITGKYLLQANVSFTDVQTGTNELQTKIVTSNHTYSDTFTPDHLLDASGSVNSTLSVVADMDASDTAVVKVIHSGGSDTTTDVNSVTTFSGCLIT